MPNANAKDKKTEDTSGLPPEAGVGHVSEYLALSIR